MPLFIVKEDIVHMKTNAVVNAANSRLSPGSGVCGAIFSAAGYKNMEKACRKIGGCATGNAVITPGFDLPADYVIHAVGPVWQGGSSGEKNLLRSCYTKSLELAEKYGLESISFPLISAGIYGYPKEEALRVAVSSIVDFILRHDMDVYLVMYDMEGFRLSKKLVSNVKSYIDDHYVDDRKRSRDPEAEFSAYMDMAPTPEDTQDLHRPVIAAGVPEDFDNIGSGIPELASPEPAGKRHLEDLLRQTEETFSESLLRLIDERGVKDSDVYKRANVDRRLFSKIRSNRDYRPSKQTVIAFCIALKLSLDETLDLLAKAGYVLTHTSKADIIIEYFIKTGNYDIFELNEVLFYFDQPLLGSVG